MLYIDYIQPKQYKLTIVIGGKPNPHIKPTFSNQSGLKNIGGRFCSFTTFCYRLLTMWFDYGQWVDVYEALEKGVKTIQIDNWLQVIPQLIARIDTPRQRVAKLIDQLLTDIGKQHPQVNTIHRP